MKKREGKKPASPRATPPCKVKRGKLGRDNLLSLHGEGKILTPEKKKGRGGGFYSTP